jgi:hypothetical protein
MSEDIKNDIEIGYEHLTELIKIYGENHLWTANEAETRKKVIDYILENVLGWDFVKDINYEVRISEDDQVEYADYIISLPSTQLVVEAKKAGIDFHLNFQRTTAKLGGPISYGETGKAIRQARDYARKKAIPFAVVTNGSAWIIFRAVRIDGIPFENTKAQIFRNFADIKERFSDFWELISRKRTIEGGIESVLIDEDEEISQRRLLSLLKEPGYRLGRNDVYQYIEEAVQVSLTDESLLKDKTGLDLCYVKTSERVKYDSRLKVYLQDLKPDLERKVTRPLLRGTSEIANTIKKSNSITQKFLLILGSVGAGKTTFIHHVRYISAVNEIEGKIPWFYIDFKKTTDSANHRNFIYNELLDAIESDVVFDMGDWNKTITKAYREKIEALRKGPLFPLYNSDKVKFDIAISEMIAKEREAVEPYVEKILSYIAKSRSCYLIIDNVDQIDNLELQTKIFVEAQAIARLINFNVLMSIRDTTYIKHKSSPPFDAFQFDTIYIDPPQMRPVLSRRFTYAKKLLEGKSVTITTDRGYSFTVPSLEAFFEVVTRSVLSDPTGQLLEVLADNDVRRGLNLVKEFLMSGHVSTTRALLKYAKDGVFNIPQHEFFKGCIFGQKKYYREEESAVILNIFDSKLGNPKTQLLRLHLLARLVDFSSNASYEGTNFSDILKDLKQIGIPEKNIMLTIEKMLEYRILRTSNKDCLSSASCILPTRFGAYIVRELSCQFMYSEPCSIDSYIYDDEFWERLSKNFYSFNTADVGNKVPIRVERVKIFLEYLQSIEKKWVDTCARYGLENGWNNKIVEKDILLRSNEYFLQVLRSNERTIARDLVDNQLYDRDGDD